MKSSGKSKAEGHLVHLSDRAVQILRRQVGQQPGIIFPSPIDMDRPQPKM